MVGADSLFVRRYFRAPGYVRSFGLKDGLRLLFTVEKILPKASNNVRAFKVPAPYHALELRSSIPAYQYAGFAKYIVMSLLFGNQIWTLREPLFSNSVYWSMCFEVYYYALFAGAFYFRGLPRIGVMALVLAIIGPEPLLRFHLWLLGAAVYFVHRHILISQAFARALFAATLLILVYDLGADLNLRIDDYLDSVTNGTVSAGIWRRFVGDTFTGAIIAAHIMAARYCGFAFGKVGAWFTYLGSFSFTLYLTHVPLLRFFTGYFTPSGPLPLLFLVLGSAWLISRVTEMQKDELRRRLRLHSWRFSKPVPTRSAGPKRP